jgi:predicted Fe-Mo cluster-binding NifX family protein/ferredoxin
MKIAVTSTGPELESAVEMRFGRCAYFLIIDTDTMQLEALQNPNVTMGGGAGIQSAQMMAEKGVQTVLTGNCGPNAFQVFGAAGIQVIVGVNGTVREAVETFKSGAYSAADGANVASHFGMGSGSGTQPSSPAGTGGGMGRGMGGGRGMGMGGGMGGGGRGMGGGGRGMGMGGGRGMGGGGRGMGMGGGMGGAMFGGFQPGPSAPPGPAQQPAGPMDREQELAMLREQAKAMEAQVNEVNARIRDLEKGEGHAGLVAAVDPKECNGCSRCVSICPTAAIALVDGVAQVDESKCDGCGQCILECRLQAIVLRKASA